jgi:hypothetical protein
MLHKFILLCALALVGAGAHAQIPVELLAGHERTTFDLLFFKTFKNKEGASSKFLFFNRNRASIDYRMTSTEYLPVLSFTEALSYNHPKLKGFAPVVVGQLSGRGLSPKAGIQYFHHHQDWTLFTWLVVETLAEPSLDHFLLARYEPRLSERLRLFSQVELFSAVPTVTSKGYGFFLRGRLGLRDGDWQAGVGADFTRAGRSTWTATQNIGLFLRHEF